VVAERCEFCETVRGEGPERIVAYQDATMAVFAARDQRPMNLGHMLVVTCKHYRNLHDLPPSLYGEVMACLRRTSEAVRLAFAATGTTIKQNNEPPGQDIFFTSTSTWFPATPQITARRPAARSSTWRPGSHKRSGQGASVTPGWPAAGSQRW
jgi:diadenosine tetraphosphate (Ap4A) HIT family hydrolase